MISSSRVALTGQTPSVKGRPKYNAIKFGFPVLYQKDSQHEKMTGDREPYTRAVARLRSPVIPRTEAIIEQIGHKEA